MPFDFGKPINTFQSSGNFNRPTPGGYKMKIVGSSITTSKKGNPQWRLELDIADGPYTGAYEKYPRQFWQDLSTDVGKSIAKRILETIINDPENAGMCNPSVLDSNIFDESIVTGLFVGGILDLDKKQNKYMNVASLCAVSVALEKAPKSDSAF